MKWLVLFKICLLQIYISSVYGRANITSKGSRIKIGDIYTTCEKNWFSYGNMCYKLSENTKTETLNWENARNFCKTNYNGDLVTIYSKELQDFLTAFLVMKAPSNVWIGLNDRQKEGKYEWVDGSPVNFTNYEPEEPTGEKLWQEDCFEMVFNSLRPRSKSGQWNDIMCKETLRFICQKVKGRTSNDTKVLDPRFCRSGRRTGWKFENSCFHIINHRKTWSEAEDYCAKTYKGHLATINFPVNVFLKYILKGVSTKLWIGVKIKEETQQKWSSGWLVSFENWSQKSEYVDGTCIYLDGSSSWKVQLCKNKLSFLCEYSTVSPPPVLKPPVKGARCPDKAKGWRDLGGKYCYQFDLSASLTWHDANFKCLRKGGTLASIHSKEEEDILYPFFMHYFGKQPHIGLYRMKNGEEFAWVDGSEVDFTSWASGEPNRVTEHCTELKIRTMKWNDRLCSLRTGYICSVPKVTSNITEDETEPQSSCKNSITTSSLLGVIACVLVFSLLIGLVLYHFRVCDRGYDRVRNLSNAKQTSSDDLEKKTRYRSEIIVTDDAEYDNPE